MKIISTLRCATAGLLLAATLPFAAAHAQMADLKALPGGGALKDVPAFTDLPGVRFNVAGAAGSGAGAGNCTEERVTSFTPGSGTVGGTMTTCNFGNFSIGTVTTGAFGGGIPGMQQFHGHYHPVQPSYQHR